MLRNWLVVLGVCWCLLASPSTTVIAAVVAGFQLVNDGSSKPPGDRLDLSVIFLPGEEELTVEVRAFYRPSGTDELRPLPSRDVSRRGQSGELLIRVSLTKPQDSRGADLPIIVPYAALDIPPGKYEMAYEVRGQRGDTIEFVRATPMVLVEVSQRSRKTMVQRGAATQWVPKRVERDAYVLQEGQLQETKIELEVAVPVQQGARTIQRVDIPGGFEHPSRTRVAAPPRAQVSPPPAPPPPAPPPPETPAPEDASGGKREALPLADTAWQSLDEFEPAPRRLVYFATNRNLLEGDRRGPDRFGKERAGLTYGSCLVNIPVETHTGGKLELPGWWQRRDPEKHFQVESLTILERSQFLAATDASDVLLFVHGYNTTFEFCVLRTAQLVHDLKFPGRGVAFSWPSAASLSGYFQDEKQNEASVEALVQILRELVDVRHRQEPSPRRIHVISHSMGNRLFLKAARQFELETADDSPGQIFGHVALAAPDVDASTFSALLPSVIRQARHVTFYYCQSDRALTASRAIHLDKPVGLGPFFAEGLDTINADRVNTEVLGHGYFASAHQLLLDLHLLLRFDLAPDQRHPPLSTRSEYLGYPHWTLALPR